MSEETLLDPTVSTADEATDIKPAKKKAAKKAATKKAAKKATKKAAKPVEEIAVVAAEPEFPMAPEMPAAEAPVKKRRTTKKAIGEPAAEAPAPEPVAEAAPVPAPVEPAPEPVIEAAAPAPEEPILEEAPVAAESAEAPAAPAPTEGDSQQPQRKLRWWERRKLERKARQAARAAANGGAPAPQTPRSEADNSNVEQPEAEPQKPVELGPPEPSEGLLEIGQKGHGFLRLKDKGWASLTTDCFVHGDLIRKYGLRTGMVVRGEQRRGPRGPQLSEVFEINGRKPEELRELPIFEELKAVNPNKRYQLETVSTRYTTRVVDMLAPVGRGQRGLIVSPPRAGKTTMLHHIAEAIAQNYPQVHLMILLVDERPEEVTEFKRTMSTAEVFASSNDQDGKSHTRIAELAIERAKRLVEMGEHVFMLMDSITRLARAYNNMNKGGATMSGGMGVGSMEVPRRLFAAARNTRTAGSLTILATALIETGSRMDDLIFQEFKGTGNMELVLDRKIAEQFFWPAVNIFRSGTRREELLLQGFQLEKIHFLRRGLAGHKPIEAIQRVLSLLERYPNNAQMLVELSSKEK